MAASSSLLLPVPVAADVPVDDMLTMAQIVACPDIWKKYIPCTWETLIKSDRHLLWNGPTRSDKSGTKKSKNNDTRKNVMPCIYVGAQRVSMRQVMAIYAKRIPPSSASQHTTSMRIEMHCGEIMCVHPAHMTIIQKTKFARKSSVPEKPAAAHPTPKRTFEEMSRDETSVAAASSNEGDDTTCDSMFDGIRTPGSMDELLLSPCHDELMCFMPCLEPPAKRARLDEYLPNNAPSEQIG